MVDTGVAGDSEQAASSSASAAAAATGAANELRSGHLVEVFGLESESGKLLNGQKGLLCEFVEDSGRWQVRLGEKVVNVKPANLRKAELFVPAPAVAEERKRSRSRSSSSSSSSSSSPSKTRSDEPPLKTGEEVEIFGLSSEAGKALNRQKGVLTEFKTDKDRWEVMLSLDKVVSLRAANLKRPKPPSGAAVGSSGQASHAKKQKTEGSLASLLGMGQSKEEAKATEEAANGPPQQWQSVWSKSTSGQTQKIMSVAAMSEDQVEYLQSFNDDAQKAEDKVQKRHAKIRQELVLQGIMDEDMVQEVIRQREEERAQLILFHGEAAARDSDDEAAQAPKAAASSGGGGGEGGKKRSGSASSSSSSSDSEDEGAGKASAAAA